jgi:hypothetical protein
MRTNFGCTAARRVSATRARSSPPLPLRRRLTTTGSCMKTSSTWRLLTRFIALSSRALDKPGLALLLRDLARPSPSDEDD